MIAEARFNVFRNGAERTREDQRVLKGGVFRGAAAAVAAAVTRALMNEPGLHAASVGVTYTAAGHAALIGRASRRVYGSFAKRSAYTRL